MKYYTAKALGRVLGLGKGEIKALTRDGVIKDGVTETGLYILEVAAREIIESMKNPEERDKSVDYSSERAKLMRAKRQNAEYDLALREKDLHQTEEIEFAISKILVGFKAKIRAIPSRVAARCAKISSKEEIFNLLKQVTDEALQELSDLETVFDDEEEM